MSRTLASARDAFPTGLALPEDVWRSRHRTIVVLLYAQAAGLALFGIVRGFGPMHAVGEASVVAISALLAGRLRAGRILRATIATAGLVLSAALFVHLSGGTIEGHFYFFVVLGVISLYQAWPPFLLALGFVVVHHGTMGVLDPTSVYNHTAAWRHPWTWAAIHGAFVLAASGTNLIAWKFNEASRAHAETILNSAGEGIYGVDAEGRIAFANRAAARLLGWGVEDLVGRPAGMLLGRRTREIAGDAAEGAVSEIYRRRDGSEFTVECVVTPLVGRGGGTVVAFRDVTERARTDAELKTTLSLLSATLESTADGILVVDQAGRISSFNRKFVEMWRMPPEIVEARDDDRAIAFVLEQLADPDGFVRKVRELYAQPDAESFDVLAFKDGRVLERYSVPQRVGGAPVGRVWSFRDVTERNRAHALEARRARQLGSLAAVAHDLAGTLDSEELLPAIAAAAREVVGCRIAELCVVEEGGRRRRFDAAGELGPTDSSPLPEEVASHALASRGVVRLQRADGGLLAVPVVRTGRVRGYVCLAGKEGAPGFDEVDEAVAVNLAAYAAEAIEVARAFQSERDRAERLRALDEMKNAFLTAVSHELRTPLTAILGFALTLQTRHDTMPSERRGEVLERIASSARRLERLLAELLDLDRLGRGIIEPARRRVDVADLVRRVVGESETLSRRDVHLPGGPVWGTVDPARVERIVENLLINAQKHTPEDTPVWVQLEERLDGVELAVEDAGPGVPAELADSIFESFRQGPGVARHSPGVGIGLALVRRLAELHGGRAWVEPREGGGASFRVWLPNGEPAPEPVAAGY